MKPDAIATGIAGIIFGLIAGWIIGSQQSALGIVPGAAPTSASAPAPAQAAAGAAPAAAVLDENKVKALSTIAEQQPTSAQPRIDLGNLYFDSERYTDAIKWYGDAFKLTPRSVLTLTSFGFSLNASPYHLMASV